MWQSASIYIKSFQSHKLWKCVFMFILRMSGLLKYILFLSIKCKNNYSRHSLCRKAEGICLILHLQLLQCYPVPPHSPSGYSTHTDLRLVLESIWHSHLLVILLPEMLLPLYLQGMLPYSIRSLFICSSSWWGSPWLLCQIATPKSLDAVYPSCDNL